MTIHTNECVDCGLPCIGASCPYQRVATTYCDICENGDTYADYNVDGIDMCASCAEKYIKSVMSFNDDEDLSIREKALYAGVDLISLE